MPALILARTPLAAARAARRLCDAQDGVLFGPQVATLDRLVLPLLAASGDRRAVLDPLAERLVAVEAAREAGGAFAGLLAEGGTAAALAGALAELRRGEVLVADVRAAARTLDGAAATRLAALADALAAYEARLARAGALDRAGAMRAAAEAASRGASCPETADLDLLVVAGLGEASAAEWDLLAALVSRAGRTRLHLPFFPERADACTPVEPLLRRFEALHELAAQREIEVVLGRLDGEGRAPLPAALLAVFGGGRVPGPAGGGEVLAVAAAGEEGEADAAARTVAALVEGGMAAEEVAVIAAAPRRLAAPLARALAARGVPLSTGRGPALADLPPVRAILDAIAAAAEPTRSTIERLAASSYVAPAGVGGPLGVLLDRAGAIDGRAAPLAALRRRAAALRAPAAARERAALERASAGLEALEALLRPLSTPATPREHARRLGGFLDAAGVRRRAARGPRDVVARDLAALRALEEAADALSRALAIAGRGAERLQAGTWGALLGVAVEGDALPAPPEPASGAVELWGVDDAPGLSVRAAVIVGCGEGAFPAPAAPDPLFRDVERIAVARQVRRTAVSTAAARRAEAQHRAFCAAAAGREVVAFVWAAPGPSGRGGPLAPLVADALAAIGVTAPAAPAPEPALAAARTEREALRAAARLGPAGAAALAGTPLAARARAARDAGAIEAARGEALRARRPSQHAGRVAGPAGAALRAALPAEWSPTQLETYARCPFRLFLQLGARLPDPAAGDLDQEPRDEGSLLHAALERFVAARRERRAWPPLGDEADVAEAHATAEVLFARFEAEGRTGDPAVWAARREAVLSRLARVVQAEGRDHDGLAPALLEHRFGGRSGRAALEVRSDGETVLLQGRIDRVDASGDRLLVLDYKNARDAKPYAELLEPDAMGVTSFQVPTYLAAAARELPGRGRLEAAYALLRKAARTEPFATQPGDPLLAVDAPPPESGGDAPVAAPGPRGFAAGVVDVVRRIREGEFPIAPRACEGCPYGAVCRVEGSAVEADDAGGPA